MFLSAPADQRWALGQPWPLGPLHPHLSNGPPPFLLHRMAVRTGEVKGVQALCGCDACVETVIGDGYYAVIRLLLGSKPVRHLQHDPTQQICAADSVPRRERERRRGRETGAGRWGERWPRPGREGFLEAAAVAYVLWGWGGFA